MRIMVLTVADCPNARPALELVTTALAARRAEMGLAEILAGVDPAEANLAEANPAEANPAEANLVGVDLAEVDLAEVDLVEVDLVEVADEAEAARLGMYGSPTVLIDGVDPFAPPGAEPSLSCRLYWHPDGTMSGLPDADALRRALAGKAAPAAHGGTTDCCPNN
ncbi:pentapeptide repeat-containing protein [Kitasatospora sp. NPDC092948]|uniref:pentapeptide repeat-containing protein n=1 Tax=Kitasatospora sp. NPDC092948 TaxID=3364088 RepID=UPI0037FBAB53